MRIKELILEGGNIWQEATFTTRRIKREEIPATVKFLEKITGLEIGNNLLGTTGKKPDSSDIDIAVDAQTESKDNLVNILKTWSNKHNIQDAIKKTGLSVHFCCPIEGNENNGFVQVDFMFMPDINFARWIYSPQEESAYKNIARILIIASLAAYDGWRFSTERGLVDRKTNQTIPHGLNPTYIAKILLGKKASVKNLNSVESIFAALKNDPKKDEKLALGLKSIEDRGLNIIKE